jgi:hypothetical protein
MGTKFPEVTDIPEISEISDILEVPELPKIPNIPGLRMRRRNSATTADANLENTESGVPKILDSSELDTPEVPDMKKPEAVGMQDVAGAAPSIKERVNFAATVNAADTDKRSIDYGHYRQHDHEVRPLVGTFATAKVGQVAAVNIKSGEE